jgi:hypothetical protein
MARNMEEQRQLAMRLQDPVGNANGTPFNSRSGTVTITLNNTGEEAKQIAICPAAYGSAELIKDEDGVAVDYILADAIE